MVICAHHFPGRFPQPVAGPVSMGVGVFYLRQRRTINHAELSIGAEAAGVKTVNDLAI